ncbi:MAG: NTP transferase domain-containing protein [Flavobacteriaceae bacterium]|nr:NTP transferase domain-containing protein [Flavobacteriaceae bacterium]
MKNLETQIYLLSGNLNSGKTTALQKFIKRQASVNGFLSPEINGKRHFQHIQSNAFYPMEKPHGGYEIGRYSFDKDVFDKVASEFQKMLNSEEKYLILDEIGPLEVRKNQGFHDLLLQIESGNFKPKIIILVLRNHLINEFLSKYKFEKIKIISTATLQNNNIQLPDGLVLAGGQSTRMQADKALIPYHKMPQFKYVEKLLNYFCDKVHISINPQQAQKMEFIGENIIVDNPNFQGHGPMTALMSAVNQISNKALMYIACDYPNLDAESLFELINQRISTSEATYFIKNERIEPMIALLEPAAICKLKSFFEAGNDSMYKFLHTINGNYIALKDENTLLQINSKEELKNLKFGDDE